MNIIMYYLRRGTWFNSVVGVCGARVRVVYQDQVWRGPRRRKGW